MNVRFCFIDSIDTSYIHEVSNWYFSEWKIPLDFTFKKLSNLSKENKEFQILLFVDEIPVASGGVHTNVSLQKRVSGFEAYQHWLAWVYTLPEYRNKGLGEMLCKYIEEQAKALGVKKYYLYTYTAESLYTKLGWEPIERREIEEKKIVVMHKDLI